MKLRERDSFIMVETIAQISNPEGTKLDPAWLRDNKKPSWSTGLWPKVRKPSEKMWKAWRSALKTLTQDGSHLRRKLGKRREIPENRRYQWMQDGEWAFINNNEIRKHCISNKQRRKGTIDSRSLPTNQWTKECTPTEPPEGNKIEIYSKAKVKEEERIQITDEISIQYPNQLRYMIQNLEIEDENTLNNAIPGQEIITVISDGGLKLAGDFGWVVALDKEVFANCYRRVTRSIEQLSLYPTGATGMSAAAFMFNKIANEVITRPGLSMWSDNTGLVNRT